MKKISLLLGITFILVIGVAKSFAYYPWITDMRDLFLSGDAIIYGINIRTFAAQDKNGDGIIDEKRGEQKGNFVNAITRLDEIAATNVNTINLLPVLPIGKVKAIGTAGSLYAPVSFNKLNPQLKAPKSPMTINEEMENFVNECHRRKLRVIVDLPCCASFELYMKNPSLFLKDANQNPVTISDWTDVRVLDAGDENNINPDVYKLYSDFINMMISMGVDGVRVCAPRIKPYTFWQKLISQTRKVEPQFLFLAETVSNGNEIITNPQIKIITTDKLLDAGFDGFYGKYDEFSQWNNANKFFEAIHNDVSTCNDRTTTKNVLANFVTHNQISPTLTGGTELSDAIMWLQATLPINSYFIDGFSTGDNYMYPKANKKASSSQTDDEYYFVHRGKMDIFNFSRKPVGANTSLSNNFSIANSFKLAIKNMRLSNEIVRLRTNKNNVFAYSRSNEKQNLIVICNMDLKKENPVKVYIPKIDTNATFVPIKFSTASEIKRGRININLKPGEIFVALFIKV